MFIWGVVGGRCDIIRKKIRMKVEQRDRKLESGGELLGKKLQKYGFFMYTGLLQCIKPETNGTRT